VAAANSISDIYAMGGTPITALNLVCFPTGALPLEILSEILRGAIDKINEAGAVLVGGHSINDKEPKFGLCVTGLIHPDRIIRNKGAQVGDRLILTKPLGSGVITTAARNDQCELSVLEAAINVMMKLNRDASLLMVEYGAHAATDITGFGLLGHGLEMAQGSHVTLAIEAEKVPLIPGVVELAQKDIFSGGSHRNWKHAEKSVKLEKSFPGYLTGLLADAQTSGGLLISMAADKAGPFVNFLKTKGVSEAAEIGEVLPLEETPIILR
jgi:selenide,water dikinase